MNKALRGGGAIYFEQGTRAGGLFNLNKALGGGLFDLNKALGGGGGAI